MLPAILLDWFLAQLSLGRLPPETDENMQKPHGRAMVELGNPVEEEEEGT